MMQEPRNPKHKERNRMPFILVFMLLSILLYDKYASEFQF